MNKSPLKLERTRRFEKDYKKLIRQHPKLQEEILDVVDQLMERKPLDPTKRDHPLKGNLKGTRDCHIRGDVVQLVRSLLAFRAASS